MAGRSVRQIGMLSCRHSRRRGRRAFGRKPAGGQGLALVVCSPASVSPAPVRRPGGTRGRGAGASARRRAGPGRRRIPPPQLIAESDAHPEGRPRRRRPGRPRRGARRVRPRGRSARLLPGRSALRPARGRGLSANARDRPGSRGRAVGGRRGRGGQRRAGGDRRGGGAAGERRAGQPRDDGARGRGGRGRDARPADRAQRRGRLVHRPLPGAAARLVRGGALARPEPILPEFRRVFAEQGLPQDLAYVALVESAFKTSAYSRAKAKGVFQFVSATGRRYGLAGRPVDRRARRSREGDARRGPAT